MTGKKQNYGENEDGSWSVCRAKPENVGKYNCHHKSHAQLTADEAQKRNEQAYRDHVAGEDRLSKKTPSSDETARKSLEQELKIRKAEDTTRKFSSAVSNLRDLMPSDVSMISVRRPTVERPVGTVILKRTENVTDRNGRYSRSRQIRVDFFDNGYGYGFAFEGTNGISVSSLANKLRGSKIWR
jgi:hypothetical protein